eukprot:359706-Chlamydomonas_euryale.AAC.4
MPTELNFSDSPTHFRGSNPSSARLNPVGPEAVESQRFLRVVRAANSTPFHAPIMWQILPP